jgi:hypothetical protein
LEDHFFGVRFHIPAPLSEEEGVVEAAGEEEVAEGEVPLLPVVR